MAGKSTVLRSTVAVALLAACGFYAPVASAQVRVVVPPLHTHWADRPCPHSRRYPAVRFSARPSVGAVRMLADAAIAATWSVIASGSWS